VNRRSPVLSKTAAEIGGFSGRGIRVASKQELIDRIHQYFQEINADPVVFGWKYKMDETFIVYIIRER
jgi:hypothetical protein